MKKKTSKKNVEGKVREIVTYAGKNCLLRRKAKPVKNDESVVQLAADMIATCENANLVGLAAPQIGVSKRVILIWLRPTKYRPNRKEFGPLVMVNPVIHAESKNIVWGYEACGSLPGIFAKVPRKSWINVQYLDPVTREKKTIILKGLKAVVAQHEIEHLEGGCFLDTADTHTIMSEKEYFAKFAKTSSKK